MSQLTLFCGVFSKEFFHGKIVASIPQFAMPLSYSSLLSYILPIRLDNNVQEKYLTLNLLQYFYSCNLTCTVRKLLLPFPATVHLPRIGYNTLGFNWYGTERLIRKHLSSRGIPTYVYPYLLSACVYCVHLVLVPLQK